jgi:molecular chaperone DnaJ
MSEDFYEVLGVSRDASEEEIKRAYREKASEYHPDVSDDPNAKEKFQKIKTAKEVLTDEEKRSAYDRMGHERFEEAKKRGGFDGGPGGAGGMGGMGGDPFGGAGGGLGDIFEQFFGGGNGQSRDRPQKGRDLRTTVELDLEDVYEGVERRFTVTRPERCPDCDGSGHPPGASASTCPECNGQGRQTQVRQTPLGRVQQTQTCRRCEGEGELYDETCSECRGRGQVRREATLTVEVPAGIRDGQTLRMEGEGAPGERGGPNGDLLVDVAIRDHEEFRREADDLYHRAPISFPQAVFGDEIAVPTPSGTATMSVPGGTQSGETFRLEGEGMPRLRRRGHGDLYVQVQVVTPDSLNEDQKEALQQFAEAGGEEVDVREGFFEKIRNSF